ncbi:hypothetical protein FACS1894190_07110 [Spirochaetia bacterium]|nr:hypothetical protein FACS1894190_07110 [Spirochaetia bacterium]
MRNDKKDVHIFIDRQLNESIESYCRENNIESRSEFLRYAITRTITPDVKDATLTFESLRQLHDKQKKLEEQNELSFLLLKHFIHFWMLYHGDIDAEHKDAALRSGKIRFNKFFDSFKDMIKRSPALLSSLLADMFEDK